MGVLQEYKRLREGFSLVVPERFSFPLDVFDRWADALCLFWTDGEVERKLTFRELRELSSKGAGLLKDKGLREGQRALLMLPAVPEWWELMLALMRLNAVPVPATTMLTPKDIRYRLEAAEIRALITDRENAGKVETAIAAMKDPPLLIIIGERQGWVDYLRERGRASPHIGERGQSDSPALIYFTSGTTGPPKMVLHTQTSYPLAHWITGRYWLDLRPGDLHWNLSDTGWAKAAWSSLFGPWNMGATLFVYHREGRFDPMLTLEILERYPVTTFCGPPTSYRMMVKEGYGRFRSQSLRHFVSAGEPLNPEVIELWQEKTGFAIYDGYGQTETVNIIANLKCLPIRPGSMGMPVPGFEAEVVDDSGEPVGPDEEGNIALRVRPVRPVGLFKEYLGNPEATAGAYRGDWYITGDRAKRDKDGYFWFVGRADDVIISSGYRIGPFEIESVLIEHPAVEESAVVASPDEVRGEVVKAFVVLTEGHAPSDALVKELQDFVKGHTAPYKYPRKVEFVRELPKTISGKIKRKELKLKEWSKPHYQGPS